jgi:hypothetical protein
VTNSRRLMELPAFAIYAEGDRPERQVDGDQAQRPAGRPQPEEGTAAPMGTP